ncbi:hypothetical protein [Nocardia asiatica]|uniref:hypothetical protein n=1 Tax=Nocardia asiatica TaxID=209252 RepID=UPI002456FC4F|nr:hypothetical protein [Nocardia asiatica]
MFGDTLSVVGDEPPRSGRIADQSLAGLSRSEKLAALRARMAAIDGRVGATEPPLTAIVDSSKVLPIAGGLGDALPGGGLPRGAVVACTGRRGPLLGMLAAATAAGEWTAVVGWPELGLLAVAEMGGDLSRVAHIAAPGPAPLEVAAVLLDGVPVVVFDASGSAPPSRMRALLARVRSHDAVLVVTSTTYARPDLEIRSELAGYEGLGRGRGRLRAVSYDISVHGRSLHRSRTTRVQLSGVGAQRARWATQHAAAAATSVARTG